MNAWFGKSHPTLAYLDSPQVPRPVNEICAHCREPIGPHDDGWTMPFLEKPGITRIRYLHRACYLRPIIGSVAHQEGRCACSVPDSTCSDDPALSRRQAAEAALAFFESRRH